MVRCERKSRALTVTHSLTSPLNLRRQHGLGDARDPEPRQRGVPRLLRLERDVLPLGLRLRRGGGGGGGEDALARAARKSFLDNLGVVNLVVISTFGLGIAYSLLGTDIRAIAALYYFDLGPDVYPGFARGAVALDLLIRLPGELLHSWGKLSLSQR